MHKQYKEKAHNPNENYDLIVYPNKKKIIKHFAVSMIFVATGISLLLENEASSSWIKETFEFLAVYLGLPFSGLTGIIFLIKIINPSPSIIISGHGIQVTGFGGATLHWPDIANMRIEQYQGNRFLAISPKNPDIMLKQQSLWGRTATKLNASFTKRPPAIFISETLIDMPLEKLIFEIDSRTQK